MSDGWVEHRGVRIHYLEQGRGRDAHVPVLIVPGMGERAAEYEWLLDSLDDRHVVAVDVRGRGKSDAPETGYTWDDHVDDVEAVLQATQVARPVFVGFSRGTSYAYGYLLRHPGSARGLVIGDYWPRHVGLPPEVLPGQLATVIRGVPMSERMPEHAVRGVVDESHDVPLLDRLGEFGCPVLLVRGGRRSAIVKDELAERYRAALPSIQVALIADAGHDLWSRDPDAYLAVLRPFLAKIDDAAATD
jgi:pimeloyl-ACP methyl ester carboxylesterase